jgi:hypothetical protein
MNLLRIIEVSNDEFAIIQCIRYDYHSKETAVFNVEMENKNVYFLAGPNGTHGTDRIL